VARRICVIDGQGGVIGYGLTGIFANCWLSATYLYRRAHRSQK
jgi:hypothetical protein